MPVLKSKSLMNNPLEKKRSAMAVWWIQPLILITMWVSVNQRVFSCPSSPALAKKMSWEYFLSEGFLQLSSAAHCQIPHPPTAGHAVCIFESELDLVWWRINLGGFFIGNSVAYAVVLSAVSSWTKNPYKMLCIIFNLLRQHITMVLNDYHIRLPRYQMSYKHGN